MLFLRFGQLAFSHLDLFGVARRSWGLKEAVPALI
jgi:hypothetical protein